MKKLCNCGLTCQCNEIPDLDNYMIQFSLQSDDLMADFKEK